jgi:hypothetical protein
MRHVLQRLPRGGRSAAVLAAAVVMSIGITSVATGAIGDEVLVGKRTAAEGTTAIVGFTPNFATRQSNGQNGDGGAASYGCRAALGREPCLYALNHQGGLAFRFRTKAGETGGEILVSPPSGKTANDVRPFTTNANGVATGLNADRLDGQNADELLAAAREAARPLFAAVPADGTGATGRGLASTGAVQKTGTGAYAVTFASDVSKCAATATQTTVADAGAVGVAPVSGNANALQVVTRAGGGDDGTGATAPADRPFHLVVNC